MGYCFVWIKKSPDICWTPQEGADKEADIPLKAATPQPGYAWSWCVGSHGRLKQSRKAFERKPSPFQSGASHWFLGDSLRQTLYFPFLSQMAAWHPFLNMTSKTQFLQTARLLGYWSCSFCWGFLPYFQFNYFGLYLWVLTKYPINVDSCKPLGNSDFPKSFAFKGVCLIPPPLFSLKNKDRVSTHCHASRGLNSSTVLFVCLF